MRILLDTHAFLWYVNGSSELSYSALTVINDAMHQRLLSIVSLWEIAIKVSIGKLNVGAPLENIFPDLLLLNDIRILNIELDHVMAVSSLPFHHGDPFDRMLVAQSLTEQMPIVSRDTMLDAYAVQRIW